MFVHFSPEKKATATPKRTPTKKRAPCRLLKKNVVEKATTKSKIPQPTPTLVAHISTASSIASVPEPPQLSNYEENNYESKFLPNTRQQPLPDTMIIQALKETSVDETEKKLASTFNDIIQPNRISMEQLLLKLHRSGTQIHQAEPNLLALFELNASYDAQEQELAFRRAELQKARDTFFKELTNYDAFLTAKMDKIGQMNEKFQEHYQKLDSFAQQQSAGSAFVKPIMVDKEVQAFPEPTCLVRNSPSMEYLSSHLCAQMPASPVLRTTSIKKSKPKTEPKPSIQATPMRPLNFNLPNFSDQRDY